MEAEPMQRPWRHAAWRSTQLFLADGQYRLVTQCLEQIQFLRRNH